METKYVYKHFPAAGCYTVGHYSPDGTWNPSSDHALEEDAQAKVHYMNGYGIRTSGRFGLARVQTNQGPDFVRLAFDGEDGSTFTAEVNLTAFAEVLMGSGSMRDCTIHFSPANEG